VSATNDTFDGELTELTRADNASVAFRYYEAKEPSTTTVVQVGDQGTGAFSASVTGLSPKTTYVVVAEATANDTTVTGGETTFTPGVTENESEGFLPPEGPFGQQVVASINYLRNSEERNLGQAISNRVTANNPGADNRPDHAGPQKGGADAEEEDEEEGDDDEEDDERGNGPR
jgi:hypothetical protein